MEEVLKKIPLLVSIAYVEDEVTRLADIVLPEHIELERFELMTSVRSALAKKFRGIMLRQPVVKPLHNTMDIADIFTELAQRIGFIDEYNEAVNAFLGLTGPNRLEPGRKYALVDIVDRHCRSASNDAHGLEDIKERGPFSGRPREVTSTMSMWVWKVKSSGIPSLPGAREKDWRKDWLRI